MKKRPPDAVKPRRYEYRRAAVLFKQPIEIPAVPGLMRAGELVTIATPLPEIPPLTPQQKEQIAKKSDVNFLTPKDWHKIDLALHQYIMDVRKTREGDYDQIIAQLNKIKASALALIESVTVDELSELALNRFFKVAGEEIYGRVSAVVAEAVKNVEKVLVDIQCEQTLPKVHPLHGFVKNIKEIFERRGVNFTCPKAKDENYSDPKPSRAQTFMRLALSELPREF